MGSIDIVTRKTATTHTEATIPPLFQDNPFKTMAMHRGPAISVLLALAAIFLGTKVFGAPTGEGTYIALLLTCLALLVRVACFPFLARMSGPPALSTCVVKFHMLSSTLLPSTQSLLDTPCVAKGLFQRIPQLERLFPESVLFYFRQVNSV